MSSKSGFLKSLFSLGKAALSHVNFSFDGASHSFHIDIVPIAPQDAVPARLPMQVAVPETTPAVQTASADADQ